MKLYEIPEAWASIVDEIEAGCGEITDDLLARIEALTSASAGKIESAVLAKRNIELRSEAWKAQAAVIAAEADRIKANAVALESAADRIGALLVPALQVTGKVKTAAGTVFIQKRTNWAFELKAGCNFFELPAELWRQREPELNKKALKALADEGQLPEEILASKTETTSVCLKSATPKGKEKEHDA